ncbi:hypothetical protein A4X09_0g2328 [Tilletia walkeri]|uniref:Uncharacterized protein n=1 Tax=Tilletia walkeri TaxID=117179 RepID=A0A8X7NA69_9BASI|nr:hypothetical protein A4X09_0g2328 [Tilletia walkeri]
MSYSKRTISVAATSFRNRGQQQKKSKCIHWDDVDLAQRPCEASARAPQSSRSSLRLFNTAEIFTARVIPEISVSLKALCDGLVGHDKLENVDLSHNDRHRLLGSVRC